MSGCFLQISGWRLCRQNEHGYARSFRIGFERVNQRVAIESGHLEIGEDDVRADGFECFQGRGAVGCGFNRKSPPRKRPTVWRMSMESSMSSAIGDMQWS